MAWNALIAISMVCMCLAVWLLFWRMSQLPKDISYELQRRTDEHVMREQRAEKRADELATELYLIKKSIKDKLFEEREDRSDSGNTCTRRVSK